MSKWERLGVLGILCVYAVLTAIPFDAIRPSTVWAVLGVAFALGGSFYGQKWFTSDEDVAVVPKWRGLGSGSSGGALTRPAIHLLAAIAWGALATGCFIKSATAFEAEFKVKTGKLPKKAKPEPEPAPEDGDEP